MRMKPHATLADLYFSPRGGGGGGGRGLHTYSTQCLLCSLKDRQANARTLLSAPPGRTHLQAERHCVHTAPQCVTRTRTPPLERRAVSFSLHLATRAHNVRRMARLMLPLEWHPHCSRPSGRRDEADLRRLAPANASLSQLLPLPLDRGARRREGRPCITWSPAPQSTLQVVGTRGGGSGRTRWAHEVGKRQHGAAPGAG